MVEFAVFILFIKTVLDRFYERIVIDHLAIGRPENTRERSNWEICKSPLAGDAFMSSRALFEQRRSPLN